MRVLLRAAPLRLPAPPQVAADECRHFALLERRLQETGSSYGALPAHDGLWESALESAGSLPARLAVEHCCHEARGLDVLPQTIHRCCGRRARSAALAALPAAAVESPSSPCALAGFGPTATLPAPPCWKR